MLENYINVSPRKLKKYVCVVIIVSRILDVDRLKFTIDQDALFQIICKYYPMI